MLLMMLAATASAMSASPVADAGPICRNMHPHTAVQPRAAPPETLFKRLDELPPANLVLTVLRQENGCIVPVIVRYGIGGVPDVGR